MLCLSGLPQRPVLSTSVMEQFALQGLAVSPWCGVLNSAVLQLGLVAVVLACALSSAVGHVKAGGSLLSSGLLGGLATVAYELLALSAVGRRAHYGALTAVLLMMLLVLNLVGLLPYTNALTAQLMFTVGLSLAVNVAVLVRSGVRHGLLLLRTFLPVDVPVAIVPMMVLIETASYVLKAVTLAVRLFANLTSGHILLVIVAGFLVTVLLQGGSVIGMTVSAVLGLPLMVMLVGLEVGVAVVQAIVFTLLSLLYIADGDAAH